MDAPKSYYLYNPSKPLAGVVAGLYGISFCITLFQIIRKKAWVWLFMLLAIAMEVIGYAARVVSASKPTEKGPYVVQFTLVILPPVLMAGVIYVIFARIVFWVVPPESRTLRFLWVPRETARFITLLFVGFDIISLLLQLVAAVLIAGTDPTDPDAKNKLNLGKTLGLVGVSTQIAGFGLFTVSAIRFHFAARRLSSDFAKDNQEKHGIEKRWQTLLIVVNVSCLLILIRSIYREIDFAGGKYGTTHKKEWYLYVFDTLPILLVVFLYNIFFPGSYLKHLGFKVPKEDQGAAVDVESAGKQTSATAELTGIKSRNIQVQFNNEAKDNAMHQSRSNCMLRRSTLSSILEVSLFTWKRPIIIQLVRRIVHLDDPQGDLTPPLIGTIAVTVFVMIASTWEQQRCTLQYFAVDLAAAAFASALVTPWVTAIDKITHLNLSKILWILTVVVHRLVFNKATSNTSIKSSMRKWVSKPKATFASLFIPFLVYFGTYATANMFDSFNAVQYDCDPSIVCSSPAKFAATTTVSSGLNIFKDAYFSRMACGMPTPLLSYALFTLRDAVTIYASFNLPTMIAPKLAEFPFSSITPFSNIFQSDDSRLKMAQLFMPAASQLVSTPIHLLGLDVHARQVRMTIRDRISVIRRYTGFATPLRMIRVLPSFGIGSVANTGFRRNMMARVV
ncbi:RTM1 [Fusarium beomiforme]|uniref:RTM1 n=1 Tax=Fusarium beomiforme TaxID=44412 RepID=A0A9P5A6L2_9HYPO|nr:RTM1 [Fusarium beomiforme]